MYAKSENISTTLAICQKTPNWKIIKFINYYYLLQYYDAALPQETNIYLTRSHPFSDLSY